MDEEPYQSSSSSGSQGDLSSEASTVEAGEAETPKSECRDNFGDIVVHDGFQTLRPAFRKTHRREESRVSKISRVSIRSLNGDVVDGVSESGPEFKSPVIRFLFYRCLPQWCHKFSLRKLLPPLWGFNKKLEWRSSALYESRLLVVGNKYGDQIFPRLDIPLTNKQTKFGDKQNPKTNKYRTAKYSVWNFLPINIFEQFRRFANIFFLLSPVMTFLVESPVNGSSWILSLVFVLTVSMLKQAYEDYLRHRNDKIVNKQKIQVLRNGNLEPIFAELIKVGDVIHLEENHTVPCDAVLLASSNKGQCYVMTANLDGETSLKTKDASPMTKDNTDQIKIDKIVSCIDCENPNPKLDSFLGRMSRFGSDNEVESYPLSISNLLLAGSQIKNTKELWAVAVYTGSETKMALNMKITKNKFSSVEKSLNRLLLFLCFILLAEVAISTSISINYGIEYAGSKDPNSFTPIRRLGLSIFSYPSGGKGKQDDGKDDEVDDQVHWYMGDFFKPGATEVLSMVVIWFILYNYIIPISLYVSLEVQKFLSSYFFGWDLHLYDEELDIPATSNTSDVNEELGLITHLFTDKTGTLTQNIMTFKQYSGPDGRLLDVDSLSSETWSLMIACMTLCHSVVVTEDGKFAASSPDEFALLEKCREAGFEFLGESSDGIVKIKLTTNENELQIMSYKKLAELPFDSHRKCMSVIIKETSETGSEHITVFTKGADSAVFPVTIDGPRVETEQAIKKFGSDGLRTLVFGYKNITKGEYDEFANMYSVAKKSIVNRVKLVREAFKTLECGLTLLGATGIEDKLQDDVKITISNLQSAGIVVWMLTGDKKETALSLAHASGLLMTCTQTYDLCEVIDRSSLVQLINEIYERCQEESEESWAKCCSLIVDGKAIVAIIQSSSLKRKFCFIAGRCKTVISCRLAPVQKSQMVRMIKEASKSNVTAAVGDGGNDISMIQEAHVGIGIYGREGHAAARAADFSVSQFKHLQRVFLIHGHWYYNRLAYFVQYSFYKQITCFTCQLLFAIYSNFSGSSLFESMFLFLYNTIYTAVPIVVYGVAEQTIPEPILTSNPELYKLNRGNREMTWISIGIQFLIGLWHSACIFFVWIFAWPSFEASGCGFNTLGRAVAGTAVAVTNVKIFIDSRFWCLPLVLSTVLSLTSFVVVTLLYDQWQFTSIIASNTEQFRTYTSLFSEKTILPHILANVIAISLAIVPDILLSAARNYRRMIYLQSTAQPESNP